MGRALTVELPWYVDADGVRVQALRIEHIFDAPRGNQLLMPFEGVAPFEVGAGWAMTVQLAEGDYVVWEPGEPRYTFKPEAFEARFSPAS